MSEYVIFIQKKIHPFHKEEMSYLYRYIRGIWDYSALKKTYDYRGFTVFTPLCV